MLAFVLRRLLQSVPTVLAVVLVIFVLFSVVPGSIVSSMSDDGRGPPDIVESRALDSSGGPPQSNLQPGTTL